MMNPFEQSHLLLTYLEGPAIKDWAANQTEELLRKVDGDPAQGIAPIYNEMDERLWWELLQNLRTNYTEVHGAEMAYRDLKNLQQQKGQVEAYISEFSLLLCKAGWGENDHGTIEAFKEGLLANILVRCLLRRPPPITLQDWYQATREEEKFKVKTDYALQEARQRRAGGAFLQGMAQDAKKSNNRRNQDADPRPWVPMDIDAARTNHLSDEE
jgi:hypothetical protein